MNERKEENKKMDRKFLNEVITLGVLGLISLLVLSALIYALPTGPSTVVSVTNSTKTPTAGAAFNISGGWIATFNLTANAQNPRWKAFVGNATGSFTLADGTGSTIYNWASASINGRIYATRNGSSINWPSINCSNRTFLEYENTLLGLNSTTASTDNLTQTFNMVPGNDPFYVGAVYIPAATCPTLYTYVSNASQSATFQEVPLYVAPNITLYETPIQTPAQVGYNGQRYNFQMLVPENGTIGYNSSLAYYLYVELGT